MSDKTEWMANTHFGAYTQKMNRTDDAQERRATMQTETISTMAWMRKRSFFFSRSFFSILLPFNNRIICRCRHLIRPFFFFHRNHSMSRLHSLLWVFGIFFFFFFHWNKFSISVWRLFDIVVSFALIFSLYLSTFSLNNEMSNGCF